MLALKLFLPLMDIISRVAASGCNVTRNAARDSFFYTLASSLEPDERCQMKFA
jgi:hypothetical protein